VAMGSPLGSLMANVFMCHLEDKLKRDGMIPEFYKRFVNDALSKMSISFPEYACSRVM
jgi:hypothetical protein